MYSLFCQLANVFHEYSSHQIRTHVELHALYETLLKTFTYSLQDLEPSLDPGLMFLDWFLRKKLSLENSVALSCPDILYITEESQTFITKDMWKGLAFSYHFSLIVMDFGQTEALAIKVYFFIDSYRVLKCYFFYFSYCRFGETQKI